MLMIIPRRRGQEGLTVRASMAFGTASLVFATLVSGCSSSAPHQSQAVSDGGTSSPTSSVTAGAPSQAHATPDPPSASSIKPGSTGVEGTNGELTRAELGPQGKHWCEALDFARFDSLAPGLHGDWAIAAVADQTPATLRCQGILGTGGVDDLSVGIEFAQWDVRIRSQSGGGPILAVGDGSCSDPALQSNSDANIVVVATCREDHTAVAVIVARASGLADPAMTKEVAAGMVEGLASDLSDFPWQDGD